MTTDISTQVSPVTFRSDRVSQDGTSNTSGLNSGTTHSVIPENTISLQAVNVTEEKVQENNSPVTEQKANSNISETEINEAISEIKVQFESVGRGIQFAVDEELDIVIITVTDTDTDEIVRQIPSKEIVELAKHIEESKGLLFREEV